MTKVIRFFILFALLAPFSLGPLLAKDSKKAEPKLRLEAHPRQGRAPLTIAFHAVLEGVDPSNSDYYCLKEEWDFGNDSKSFEQPQCDPYTPGSPIKSDFSIEREYDTAGHYGVRLTLGDKKIVSNKITVNVMERLIR